MPHLHHSKVIAHLVQEQGSEIQWKHLHVNNGHICKGVRHSKQARMSIFAHLLNTRCNHASFTKMCGLSILFDLLEVLIYIRVFDLLEVELRAS